MSFFDGLFGGGGEEATSYPIIEIPEFYTHAAFEPTLKEQYQFSSNLLAGNPTDYYAPIGQYGSSQFNDILNLTMRDTEKAVYEDLARRGVENRGGLGATAISEAVAPTAAKMRWADYLNALEGRKYFMQQGMTGQQNVIGNALNYGGQKNQYELTAAQLNAKQVAAAYDANAQSSTNQGSAWGDILGIIDQLYKQFSTKNEQQGDVV